MAKRLHSFENKRGSNTAAVPGAFHENHGKNIQLSEKNTVAERTSSFNNALVFTEKPIPVGSTFQVRLLEKQQVKPPKLPYMGNLILGLTLECPDDNITIPSSLSQSDWIGGRCWHHFAISNRSVHANLLKAEAGQSVGCMVNKEGELRYFLDGVDLGVAWRGLPTGKPLWGVADVYGKAKKIKLETFTIVQLKEDKSMCNEMSKEITTLREQLAQERAEKQRMNNLLEQQLVQEREEKQRIINSHFRLEQQLRSQLQQMEARVQELQRQLDSTRPNTQLQVPSPDEDSWNVPRNQVEIIEEIGRGGWGLILKGRFKGQVVAVKKAYREILRQPYTIRLMKREIQIMASVQHPNLVRFVAAVIDDKVDRGIDTPLLVVELLDMDLRRAYETVDLGTNRVPIFRDVAYALHYLHEHQEPILHRDVSAPNVLLESLQGGSYRAKLSDFGSANKVKDSRTAAPGAICYTAPEVYPPIDPEAPMPPQTPKIDVFSYGVLLAEVITKTMPTTENRSQLFRDVRGKWQLMYELIVSCTKPNLSDRPTMASVLSTLNRIPTPRPRQKS